MLLYDHSRTEKVIERLRNAEAIVRIVTILSAIILFGVAGFSTGASGGGIESAIIGGAIGAVVGFLVGIYSMVLISATIEWMCQMLIAQGEIVESTKRRGDSR